LKFFRRIHTDNAPQALLLVGSLTKGRSSCTSTTDSDDDDDDDSGGVSKNFVARNVSKKNWERRGEVLHRELNPHCCCGGFTSVVVHHQLIAVSFSLVFSASVFESVGGGGLLTR
jgi:hypothetical protein